MAFGGGGGRRRRRWNTEALSVTVTVGQCRRKREFPLSSARYLGQQLVFISTEF